MVRIIIVHLSPAFIAGIGAMLEWQNAIDILGMLTSMEYLLLFLTGVNADVVLISEKLSGIKQVLSTIGDLYPDVKVLLQVPDYSEEHLRKMAEWGAHSPIREGADKEEILQAIVAVNNGEEHLPPETQALLRKIYSELADAKKVKYTKQERAILHLLKKGIPTKLIADELTLKESSVKTYRKSLNHKLGAHNATELIINAHKRGLF